MTAISPKAIGIQPNKEQTFQASIVDLINPSNE